MEVNMIYSWGIVYIINTTMKLGWIILIAINFIVALFFTAHIVLLWMIELSILAFRLSKDYEKTR